jgi:DNA (cytosine-5)-methyltransferase 1
MSEPLTFGSLFAGIGGFDLGFERAGMVCKWQVEIDDYATRVLAKHWPNVHRERDIRECGFHNLERVDVICGGFPCQDISYAGQGAGLDGERSGLFFEAIRLVRELRPRIVVLENVAALLTRGLDRVLGTLAEIGYDAEWHCIPAAAVGAPHIRDRVFVVGFRSDTTQHGWGQGDTDDGRCGKGIEAGKERRSGSVREDVADAACGDAINTKRHSKRIWASGAKIRSGLRGKPSRCDWWNTEPAVGRVANGVPARVDRLRGLGNAVVPQVAEWIGRRIVKAVQ